MACDAHTRVTKANAINPVLNECAGQQKSLGDFIPETLFYTFEKHKTLALPLHAFPPPANPVRTEDKNARQWLGAARNRAASPRVCERASNHRVGFCVK